MKRTRSLQLQKKAHALIPGGAHTYSKGDDQFPANAPAVIARGKGAYTWDVDGNTFLDWGMGLRSVVLGHAYPSVIAAVKKELPNGSNFMRPAAIEIALAEKLKKIIPCAEMVKFNKNGSAATSAAVRLARAHTKRDMVAMPAGSYNGSDDWGMATTAINAGIPQAVQKLTVTFTYNDIESVQKLFKKYPNKIACVILEPASEVEPKNNFLHELKKECEKNGAVLVFDEMITGFRWGLGGAQKAYGVAPDLATFGKAMANGFSVAALVGRKDIMSRGGMHGDHERVFLLSSTHGAETHALAAAWTTIEELRIHNVPAHLKKIGTTLRTQCNEEFSAAGIAEIFQLYGEHPARLAMAVTPADTRYTAAELKTYFLQELISQGILFNGYFAPSFSHGEKELALTRAAWKQAAAAVRDVLEQGNLHKKLKGDPVKPVFRKYN